MSEYFNWLLQKSTDLEPYCLQRQGISGFSRTMVNLTFTALLVNSAGDK